MFAECNNCGIRHDPRQPKCNLEDRIAYARKKAGLPPLVPAIDAKPVTANKSADKAQRIVKARAVVNRKASNGGASNKKQRWDKDKYNEYQRDLMRNRRADEKASRTR